MSMNKLIMLFSLCLFSGKGLAAGKIPDIDRWIESSIPDVDAERLMQKILFVKEDGKNSYLGCL